MKSEGYFVEYVGTRWYKCDFHLHTMQSACYKDKQDTVEAWIEKVNAEGLNCIAVTDHNDYRKIDEVICAAKGMNITVFPGVEVTCDSSKIHVIILFDSSKNADKVRDFLSAIDIDSERVGCTDGTSISIFEVCKKAKEKGALVIAAHIDEFSGINSMSAANVSKILHREYIDAVQVVNGDIWNAYATSKDKDKMLSDLATKYGKEIGFDEAEKWRKTYNKASDANIPFLTFSDNPCGEGESRHGLWGIGKEYTWLKMGEYPDIEGIRQALLSDDLRIVLSSENKYCPENLPDYWVKSLEMTSSVINPTKVFRVEFSPQLNTVIGGRGSGKSTVVRVLAGALQRANEAQISTIETEQKNFYKKNDSKTGLGIFTGNTTVSIELIRNAEKYHVVITDIKSNIEQKIRLFRCTNGVEEEIEDKNFLDFFKLQVYTQKQIFEIAKDPEALLKIIDSGVEEMSSLEREKRQAYEDILTALSEIRIAENSISNEDKLITELMDIESQIKVYKESGISELIEAKQSITDDEKIVSEYINTFKANLNDAGEKIEELQKSNSFEKITDKQLANELDSVASQINTELSGMMSSVIKLREYVETINQVLLDEKWAKKKTDLEEKYISANELLMAQKLETSKLDSLLQKRDERNNELKTISSEKQRIVVLRKSLVQKQKNYNEVLGKISKARQTFVDSVLGEGDSVKILIKNKSNRIAFENAIRELLQKENSSIVADISEIADGVFGKEGIDTFRETIRKIRSKDETKKYSAYFRKAIIDMDEKLYDKLISYELEDEIEVQYKPEGGRKYMPLSVASAGQKTTAILTFVLAYGTSPLLLDQPEDDLDNRLVYDLVVKRLKKAKSMRQLIIVTHNANIPVNGDAEYITSMNSESRFIEVKKSGSLDCEEVRKDICDVMEGTEHAFEMRAKKYHLHIVE